MIKNRVFDSVKFYLQNDSAIDAEKSDYNKYFENFDESYLVFKDGQVPTVFILKQVSVSQKIKIQQLTGMLDRALFFLRCGLVDVSNFFVEKCGETLPISRPTRASAGEWGEIVTEKWIDESRLNTDDILRIGAAVMTISEARSPL